jgi:hypothetical protein
MLQVGETGIEEEEAEEEEEEEEEEGIRCLHFEGRLPSSLVSLY